MTSTSCRWCCPACAPRCVNPASTATVRPTSPPPSWRRCRSPRRWPSLTRRCRAVSGTWSTPRTACGTPGSPTRPRSDRFSSTSASTAAYPYGIFLSYCANLQCAFDLGASLIRSAEADEVLVVCTDKADPASGRLVEPKISVHSDGAASFALTHDRLPGSYRLVDTVLTINPRIGAIDADRQFIEYFGEVTEGIAAVVEKALTRTGLTVSDIARVFTNNYNEMIATIVAKLIGFSADQLYLDNIPRFAHSLAADAIINLVDCAATSPWAGGESLLVLGTGPIQWGCSILETQR